MPARQERATPDETKAAQPQFRRGRHDGVQYHFFCGDKLFFSTRVVESQSLRHHSAWLFDGQTREIVNSSEPLKRIGDRELNLEGPQFQMRADDVGGRMAVMADGARPVFEITFTSPVTTRWAIPLGVAVHQPLLQGEITYGGRTYRGLGYCKRYWYHEDIEYWGWRFIQGQVGQEMLWTAEATFGHLKYDYFKIARPDGTVEAAGPTGSFHREDAAYGTIGKTSYEVRIEELGLWETTLRTERMNAKLRQRFCRMTVRHDGKIEEGVALNETGMGTIF